VEALIQSHPYEEPAYDLFPLQNVWNQFGAGILGELPEAVDELEFLGKLKTIFNIAVIRHTGLLNKKSEKLHCVAVQEVRSFRLLSEPVPMSIFQEILNIMNF